MFWSQVYGVGDGAFYPLLIGYNFTEPDHAGIQKVPTWVRIFLQFAKANGHSGTFGAGYNSMSNIHVKDVASAIITILTAALQKKTDEGYEGLCKSQRQLSV